MSWCQLLFLFSEILPSAHEAVMNNTVYSLKTTVEIYSLITHQHTVFSNKLKDLLALTRTCLLFSIGYDMSIFETK